MKKAVLVADPDAPRTVRADGIHDAFRHGANGNKPVRLEQGHAAIRGDPQIPAIVLKKGVHLVIRQPIACDVPPRHHLCASLTVSRDVPFVPSVQAIIRAEPHGSIGRRENGRHATAGQTFLERNRRDGEFAKAVEAINGRDPHIAFAVLKESGNGIT